MLLSALLLIVAVIVWLVVAPPWRGEASTPSDAEPQVSDVAATELPSVTDAAEETTGATPPAESPEPAASSTPTAEACEAGDIVVDAVTDADTYGAGQNPGLSIKLTNNGPACSLNVGTTTQVFAITSGADTWWRSTDCQSEPSDMIVLLAAGQSVSSSAPVTWDRTRSAVGSCADTNRPAAPAGGASYHLSVSIGGIDSTQSKQFLLY
ncbi:hypothetical protein GCM10009775_09390 [Microbacterium aoyamense]|uniref:DUF4232 domain-containing protein n=1 Tax=Microbacterium aoyamense TaxID=344166 RepID=A0ABP5AP30_9MICO